MKNLIIGKAYIYEESPSIKTCQNIHYDDSLGFWIVNDENIPLVESDSSYSPQSKKCDVETGEDKKGE